MFKWVKRLTLFVSLAFVTLYTVIGLTQEQLIFFPTKLASNYQFNFAYPFEEIDVITEDSLKLHGVLFKADSSKGLIFYLHGNSGNVNTWGSLAQVYTNLNYDVFILDYRGYGKSEGRISSE